MTPEQNTEIPIVTITYDIAKMKFVVKGGSQTKEYDATEWATVTPESIINKFMTPRIKD